MFNLINNLELLNTFIAVSESDTLLQASKKLKLSQATVSIRLKKMQEFFDFPLFEKRGRKIIILEDGLALKETMKKSLENVESELASFHFKKNVKSLAPIRMGARQEVFLKFGEALKVDFPLELTAMKSFEAKTALLQGTLDVAIAHQRPESLEYIAQPLFIDRFVFCCQKKLAKNFTGLNKKDLKELAEKLPALIYGKDSRVLNDFFKHFEIDSKKVRTGVICEDWTVLKNFMMNGTGFGIFPKTFVDQVDSSVIKIEVPDKILKPLQFYYIFKREFRHNAQIKTLGMSLKVALKN